MGVGIRKKVDEDFFVQEDGIIISGGSESIGQRLARFSIAPRGTLSDIGDLASDTRLEVREKRDDASRNKNGQEQDCLLGK